MMPITNASASGSTRVAHSASKPSAPKRKRYAYTALPAHRAAGQAVARHQRDPPYRGRSRNQTLSERPSRYSKDDKRLVVDDAEVVHLDDVRVLQRPPKHGAG